MNNKWTITGVNCYSTRPVYFTTTLGRHRWYDLCYTWQGCWNAWRNHPIQISNQLIHKCDFGKWLKFHVLALIQPTPLTRLSPACDRSLDNPCTNVDTCISGLSTAILNFWVISACVTIDKDLLEFPPTKNLTYNVILFYHITHIRVVSFSVSRRIYEMSQSRLVTWASRCRLGLVMQRLVYIPGP